MAANKDNMTIGFIEDKAGIFTRAPDKAERDIALNEYKAGVDSLTGPLDDTQQQKLVEQFQKMQAHFETLNATAKGAHQGQLGAIKTALAAKGANPDDIILEEIAPGMRAGFNAADEFKVTTDDGKKVEFNPVNDPNFPYGDLFGHDAAGHSKTFAEIAMILWNHHRFQAFKHYGWRMAEVGRRMYDVGAQEREILRLNKLPKMPNGSTRPDVKDQIQQCRDRIAQNRDGYNGKAIKKEIDGLVKLVKKGALSKDDTQRLAVLRQDLAKQHGDDLWSAMRDARKDKPFARDIDLGRRERKELLTYIKNGVTNNPAAQRYFSPKVVQDAGNSGARATAEARTAAMVPAAGMGPTITMRARDRAAALSSATFSHTFGMVLPTRLGGNPPSATASTRGFSMFGRGGVNRLTASKTSLKIGVETPETPETTRPHSNSMGSV